MSRIDTRETGGLVVSLDFELHWGVRDHSQVHEYRENLLGAREAIPSLLRLFERYNIHATWATVGMLFCADKQQLIAACPALRPEYRIAHLSPYPDLDSIGDDEESDPFHFAPSLIRLITSTAGQEIGTHTFSHFCCLEDGATVEAFEADLASASNLAARFGITLKSLVFPRNQYSSMHLEACTRAGIISVRGNQPSWIYAPSRAAEQGFLRRGLRLADAYVALTGANARQVDREQRPVNIPASRFLRPYHQKLKRFERFRHRRIVGELDQAAERKQIYHLWWHPHNFGVFLRENLEFLESILQHAARLRAKRGFGSWTMHEAARGIAANPD